MSSVTNEKINISSIQLYVQNFINIIYDNPTYASAQDGGATPKVLNELFIEGFQPLGFRLLVKDLGTTELETTIGSLNQLYKDVAIYTRVGKRLGHVGVNKDQSKKPDEDKKLLHQIRKTDTARRHSAIARSIHLPSVPSYTLNYGIRLKQKTPRKV